MTERRFALSLTETNLSQDISDAELGFSSYNVFLSDRSYETSVKASGGGVLLAVKCCYPSLRMPISTASVEQTLISVTTSAGVKVLAGVVYIPPDTSVNSYETYVTSIDEAVTLDSFSRVLLMGDLNQPEIDWSTFPRTNLRSGPARALSDLTSTLDLTQVNLIENTRGVILDVILSSDIHTVVSRDEPLVPEDVHHPALRIALPSVPTAGNKTSYVHNFKKFGSSFPPWFSPELKRLVTEKKRLHLQYKRTLNDCTYYSYSRTRSNCKRLSQECFDNYINHVQNILPSNPNRFWSFVDGLKKNHGTPSALVYNGTSSTCVNEQCEMFADFFSSVFTSQQQPPTSLDSVDSCNVISHCIFSEDEVRKELLNLNVNKGSGPDMIPPGVLKYCHLLLSGPLQELFNKSVSSGVFPDVLQKSYVVPIHKSGTTSEVTNYRPIAVQSVISKVFERLVLSRVSPLLQRCISSHQHGFSPGKSAATNLVVCQSDIISSFSRRKQVDAIFLDFSKAFDRLRNQDVHKYGTRSSTDFVLPPHHLTLYSKKPTYAGAKFFNLLPDDMKNHNPQQLKRHLKDWLLKRPFYSIEEYLRWKDFPDYT
ncbi:uncharacterized protein LOC124373592 [Homalodisca vitripennis]|uniref:uncharacterized protein LOC124373592 n=1 Tax=Homalodisca vitripennis TaxID=197043 RepID=UPI001EEC8D04|nr:uncharacterized protein LOC124373592 [Homalodisca vitripennis]